MKCNQCGSKLIKDSKFCPSCGSKIEFKEPYPRFSRPPEEYSGPKNSTDPGQTG